MAFPIPSNNSIDPAVYSVTGFSKSIRKDYNWISTYSALFGFDGKSFTVIDDKFLGFSEEAGKLHIRSILEDSKGNV